MQFFKLILIIISKLYYKFANPVYTSLLHKPDKF